MGLAFPAADLAHIHAHAPMSVFRGKHVFLTGASGWFGSWFKFCLKDSFVSQSWNHTLPDEVEPIDYVIHAAPSMTKETLDFAARHGSPRALFVSSGAVYEREDAYAEGKRLDEQLCRAHPLRPVIARCFSFVGPGQKLDAHWAVGNFLADALAGRTINVKGDGSAVRSYMHMADLMVWLLTLLAVGVPRRAYDVGSKYHVSIADLASRIGKLSGSDFRITGKPGGPDYYVPSTFGAEELGLKLRIGLDDALGRTYQWLKQAEKVEA